MKRFQDCNSIVKAWRRRYLLPVPIRAFWWHFTIPNPLPFSEYWNMSRAQADYRMKNWVTLDELKERMRHAQEAQKG